eukprot:m.30741 g.30741  ORF g.30741 m.30741 type:complete len:258 (-) comp6251_c0_seq3:190-963(-)
MEESGSYYQSDRGDDGRQRDKHHKRKKEHSHSHNDAVGKYIGELRHWVKREKGKQLDDVDEEKLIKYVNKFLKRWNSGELSKKYYDGKYRERVPRPHSGSTNTKTSSSSTVEYSGKRRADAQGPSYVPSKDDLEKYNYDLEKKAKRSFRAYHNMVMEELVPRETGREARVEKRKAANMTRKQRDNSPETTDAVLMGSSDDFKNAVRKREQMREAARQRRIHSASQKAEAHRQKEDETMSALFALARTAGYSLNANNS